MSETSQLRARVEALRELADRPGTKTSDSFLLDDAVKMLDQLLDEFSRLQEREARLVDVELLAWAFMKGWAVEDIENPECSGEILHYWSDPDGEARGPLFAWDGESWPPLNDAVRSWVAEDSESSLTYYAIAEVAQEGS